MKTVQVYRSEKGWAVKRHRSKASRVFPTQKEAVENARSVASREAPSQMVVIGSDGAIIKYASYGLPKIQDPPAKTANALKIHRAVGRLVLERLASDPHPPCD